jgi:hypothetical protein
MHCWQWCKQQKATTTKNMVTDIVVPVLVLVVLSHVTGLKDIPCGWPARTSTRTCTGYRYWYNRTGMVVMYLPAVQLPLQYINTNHDVMCYRMTTGTYSYRNDLSTYRYSVYKYHVPVRLNKYQVRSTISTLVYTGIPVLRTDIPCISKKLMYYRYSYRTTAVPVFVTCCSIFFTGITVAYLLRLPVQVPVQSFYYSTVTTFRFIPVFVEIP